MAKRGKVRWDRSKSPAQNARLVLPRLAAEYVQVCEIVAAGKLSLAALHQFRLRTKRFRYTLELFRPCYGQGLQGRLDALHGIQQDLGEINDCRTTRLLVGRRKGIAPEQRARILSFLAERAAAKKASLVERLRQEVLAKRRWWCEYFNTAQDRWLPIAAPRPPERLPFP